MQQVDRDDIVMLVGCIPYRDVRHCCEPHRQSCIASEVLCHFAVSVVSLE